MTPEAAAALRRHLLVSGLSGDTRTTRHSVVGNAERLAAGDPDKLLGLGDPGCDADEVMQAVSALCGCSPDRSVREGPGVIDPERTLAGLADAAARLVAAAPSGRRVLVATGHPTGPLPMYQRLVRALEAAGAKILSPADDERLGEDPLGRRRTRVRYLDRVAVLTDGVHLYHTHESWPMERLLERERPDLVLADHGFAGAAAAAGIETVAFSDVNDPAIALGWFRGSVGAVVPLDDNLPPAAYGPLAEWLEGLLSSSR